MSKSPLAIQLWPPLNRDLYSKASSVHVIWTAIFLLQGCASVYKPQNEAITKINSREGYHSTNLHRKPIGDHFILLSFSGGGTRAAALSYGVMEELRDTTVDSQGKRIRLLDEVDTISSVSGGSFTAAYYGLFGEDIFKNYEDKFLRQSIQSSLIKKLFNPMYWWRSIFTGFDRTEMAIEYYDQNIFQGKTFADMSLETRPFIEINATDLSTGSRFAFTQGMFDYICSDLDTFSVARAVTASSAVPMAFPPVVLKNYADKCDVATSPLVMRLVKKTDPTPQEQVLLDRYKAIRNNSTNAYLHLVDGGISDNLALRSAMEKLDARGGIEQVYRQMESPPKNVLVILVNAAVSPKRPFSETARKPSIGETVGALSATQIMLYNNETINLLKKHLVEDEIILEGMNNPVHFYFADVNFKSFTKPNMKEFFNALPTSLELNEEQVNSLILAGRELVRTHPEFQRFLKANNGELFISQKPAACNRLLNPFCLGVENP